MINMNIAGMALDLLHIQIFQYMVNWLKPLFFVVDKRLSVHPDNRKKDILVPCEETTDVLDNIKITAEGKTFLNVTKSRIKICLSLRYNSANSFFYVKGVKIH